MKHTYKTKSAGFNVNAYTPAPRSCASRISPAAACRLARTDRYTLEGPNHHANRVDGRGWASGAYFGALAVVMVVGGICECSLQLNWSVAKAGFCNFFCNNVCNFNLFFNIRPSLLAR